MQISPAPLATLAAFRAAPLMPGCAHGQPSLQGQSSTGLDPGPGPGDRRRRGFRAAWQDLGKTTRVERFASLGPGRSRRYRPGD
jgi:hypothetical protein